jgi:hypothetical protein
MHDFTHYLALRAQGLLLDFVFIGKNISKKDTAEACVIKADWLTQSAALETLGKYLAHFKSGHEKCFPFFPAFGKEDLKLVDKDLNEIMEFLDDEKDNSFSHDFTDTYLTKALEHGWLNDDTYSRLQMKVREILEPIQQLLPTVFNKSK